MQTYVSTKKKSSALFWFIAAGIFGILFLSYTVIYATGVLNQSTLEIERWLLWRPVTRIDCTFLEWRRLGEAPVTFLVLLGLGFLCVLAGHRKRVLIYVLLLLCIGIGVEVVGKKALDLPLPPTLRSGMTVLTCPQMSGQPWTVQVAAATGLLGQVPDPPYKQVSWARDVAQMPIVPSTGDSENSFPGGHALRWCLAGFLLAWICSRYIRPRFLGIILSLLVGLGSFLGGFMQFYIGVHFVTDTISGYLLGIALACCGIGLLLLNDKKSRLAATENAFTIGHVGMNATIGLPRRMHTSSGQLY